MPESFRPQLERMIQNGTLKDYISRRLTGLNNPSLEYRFGEELPQDVLLYFAGKQNPAPGKRYYPEDILGNARGLLRELGEDQNKAQDPVYGNGLGALLQLAEDEESNTIALDLLSSKGRPVIQPYYFSTPTEQRLIHLFATTYKQERFPGEKKDSVVDLFSKYVRRFKECSQIAEEVLLRVDYDTGLRLLSTAIDDESDHTRFVIPWNLIQVRDPVLLAQELKRVLDISHMGFFVRALDFASGGFQDEESRRFIEEINRGTSLN